MPFNFKFLFIYFFVGILIISGYSCEKEKEIVTETKVVRDTVTVVHYIPLTDTTTNFILVRHAETQSGNDPSLSAVGENRAAKLVETLSNISLEAIFSTDYNRTRETAQPIADDRGMVVQLYDTANLNDFADSNIANFKNGNILVVGHSDTTPSLLNILLGKKDYPPIIDGHDNLYIVTVYEKGASKIFHLKYGD